MLNGLWNFIKLNFKKRMYLYVLAVFSLTLFQFSPFVGLATFLISSALLVPFFADSTVSQLKLVFVKKYQADQKIRDEVNEIAAEMGVCVKKVYVAKGLRNAYVRFGTLVLGEKLLNLLGPNQRKVVIAHELAHMKEKHFWLKIVAILGLLIPTLWIWLGLRWPIIISEFVTQAVLNTMINIALLSYLIAMMVLPNWYMEIRADRIAIETAPNPISGKASLISALLAIVKKEGFQVASEDHPSVSERIKLILKYNPEKKPKNR